MTLRDQLQADLKEAMKNNDETRKTVIRGVMSSLRESEQRKREDLAKAAMTKHNLVKPSPNAYETDEEYDSAVDSYQKGIDAALTAEKVEENSTLDEGEALTIVQKLVKQRQESIEQAQQAGRSDIANAESGELTILESYLPKQLSREEIEAEARTVIAEVGAQGARDMGKVMGPLNAKLKGRADGKMISEVVKSLLS
jgi:uncharacterized protein YqeY